MVEIDVPLANIGNPPAGAVLAGPTGETEDGMGVIGSGLLEKVDTGGPACDYKVGSNPGPVTAVAASHSTGGAGTPTPNTGFPFPVIWPGLALAAAGLAALALGRRRRNRRGSAPPTDQIRRAHTTRPPGRPWPVDV